MPVELHELLKNGKTVESLSGAELSSIIERDDITSWVYFVISDEIKRRISFGVYELSTRKRGR